MRADYPGEKGCKRLAAREREARAPRQRVDSQSARSLQVAENHVYDPHAGHVCWRLRPLPGSWLRRDTRRMRARLFMSCWHLSMAYEKSSHLRSLISGSFQPLWLTMAATYSLAVTG